MPKRDERLSELADVLRQLTKGAGLNEAECADCLKAAGILDGLSVPAEAAPQPEVRLNADGTVDEVVSRYCHLEQMDFNHWFLDAGGVVVWLRAKGKISATYEYRRADGPSKP